MWTKVCMGIFLTHSVIFIKKFGESYKLNRFRTLLTCESESKPTNAYCDQHEHKHGEYIQISFPLYFVAFCQRLIYEYMDMDMEYIQKVETCKQLEDARR